MYTHINDYFQWMMERTLIFNLMVYILVMLQEQYHSRSWHGPLSRYVKLRVAHAPGNSGTFSPSSRVSDPDMHHGTCVTHVPWCMPGSLTSRFLWSRWQGKTLPVFPAHAQPAMLRIWQDAHGKPDNKSVNYQWLWWWLISLRGYGWGRKELINGIKCIHFKDNLINF